MRKKPLSHAIGLFDLPHMMQFVRHLDIRQFGGFRGQVDGHVMETLSSPESEGFNIKKASYDGVSRWMLVHYPTQGHIALYKASPGTLYEQKGYVFFWGLCSIDSIATKGHVTLERSDDIFEFLTT